MTPERFERIETLFHQARLIPTGQRVAFFDSVCGDDPTLIGEVEALLHHTDPDVQLTQWQGEVATILQPMLGRTNDLEPGSSIGPYRLLRVLGEGGMGTVYLAEQSKPIHRQVALKVIKLGMDTKQTLARFETEREALALMNHAHVAKVFDAGATNEGRPYFAMEYVEGEAVTAYCDRHRLTTEERLRLFLDVCRAVQHAHQKGIIHRDIKPSNILVADEGTDADSHEATEPRSHEENKPWDSSGESSEPQASARAAPRAT